MAILYVLVSCAVGYLVGSWSSTRLLARLAKRPEALEGVELGVEGSDQTFHVRSRGATTASLALGSRWGFVAMLLDMLKIALPTLAVRLLLPDEPYYLLTAALGMVGHVWPLYYRFRGGRGLSAVYGALWAIDWIAIFATFVGGMLIGIVILRDVILAYMAGLWLLIPWFWFRTHDWRFVAYAVFANIVFVLAMIPDIREYLEIKRQGTVADPAAVLGRTAMGRGMLHIARLFGVNK
ncbi:MAG: glycerol-3-phosphate acyltransferase [Chloroflexi bacterium]|nr:glycerol-3-phosphate acyltransferase [Chloroflexota bacterium]